MLRRLLFICLLTLASAWAAPGAMAHGAHDHGPKAQAPQKTAPEQAAPAQTAQPLCLTCEPAGAPRHDSDCCSSGCHMVSLPTLATIALRDTLQAAPRLTTGRVAHGRDPPGLKRPPRA